MIAGVGGRCALVQRWGHRYVGQNGLNDPEKACP